MKIGFGAWLTGGVALLVSLLWESLVEREAHSGFDGFGFYAWFGFGACLLMVLVALLAGIALKRGDDYYDD